MHLELIRQILDQQLVDENGAKFGRVDGLVVDFSDDGPPVVDHFQIGAVVLARRLGPRMERFVRWVREKTGAKGEAFEIVRWPLVGEINQRHIKVLIDATHTGIFDAERWLRQHVVEKIPGSGK